MTGAYAGTPSLIIPTYSERESNARRLADIGVAELMIPLVDETGEKHVDSKAFKELVFKMLSDPLYQQSTAALSNRMEKYIDPKGITDRIEALL
jgi:UDP:flavonoid glycosyltransferase YjiC (YdhE family)